jgi:hypothetical protein
VIAVLALAELGRQSWAVLRDGPILLRR